MSTHLIKLIILLSLSLLTACNQQISKFTDKVKQAAIVLDLNGDGIVTTELHGGAYFDHDHNGFAEQSAWVNEKDGVLVRDLNQNGKIDNGTELFSSETLLRNGEKAANGYQALADLDENDDGEIDAKDNAYSIIKIWKDSSDNTPSEKQTLLSLESLGINSLATHYTLTNQTDHNGNITLQTSLFKNENGKTGITAAILFKTNKIYTIATHFLPETRTITALPDLVGYGTVYNLHQAMLRDKSEHIQQLVQQFVKEINPDKRHVLMLSIIYAWTGVEDINPTSRSNKIYGNAIGDARKLAALEAVSGEPYLGTLPSKERDPNPYGDAAKILLRVFDKWSGELYGQLMAQTHFKSLFDSVDASLDKNTHEFVWNVDQTVKLLKEIYTTQENGVAIMNDFAIALQSNEGTGEGILRNLRQAGNPNAEGFLGVLSRMGIANTTVKKPPQ